MLKHYSIAVLAFSIAIMAACSSDKPSEQGETESAESSMKMAEDSELALLMRHMHEEAKKLKLAVEEGKEIVPDTAIYSRLVSSEPTNANVSGPVFEGFSRHYAEQMRSFAEASDPSDARKKFNGLVSSCVQCHQSYCTGPIPTIEKLYVDAEPADRLSALP